LERTAADPRPQLVLNAGVVTQLREPNAAEGAATGDRSRSASEFASATEETGEFALQRAPQPGLWHFTTPDRRVLALVRSETLLAALRPDVAPFPLSPSLSPSDGERGIPHISSLSPSDGERERGRGGDAKITLLPPDEDSSSALVTLSAGEHLPGWRLALSLGDQTLFDASTEHRTAVYLWTGVLVLAAMGMLALLAARLLRRQVALARLKNDLAATVSHELKTPLSSMRVLVDTLLDSEKLNEQTAREYLRLIAQENERLSRLIQNFLTFSRMERKSFSFHFRPLAPREIVDAAAEAARERLASAGCRFELEVERDLPNVMADEDALAAALGNLLDNACKFSEGVKHVSLHARAQNGSVLFSVQDRGIGIAPRERKRIFRRFYQVDPRLSRQGGGCGLGLSIVQFIVRAHHGSVSVESEPGRGSTFTIALPAARDAGVGKEASG
jgi:signal transduction histidine kinase